MHHLFPVRITEGGLLAFLVLATVNAALFCLYAAAIGLGWSLVA